MRNKKESALLRIFSPAVILGMLIVIPTAEAYAGGAELTAAQLLNNKKACVRQATSDGYKPIRKVEELLDIQNNPDGNYVLANDLDLRGHMVEAIIPNSSPHGAGPAFLGHLIGCDFAIKNWSFSSDSTTNNGKALFPVNKGVIESVIVSNPYVEVELGDTVAALVGYNFGSVLGSSVQDGSVRGNIAVGGMIARNQSGGIVEHSRVSSTRIFGRANMTGGLVGRNAGRISDSTADVVLYGRVSAGGLVGLTTASFNNPSLIERSSSSGAVLYTAQVVAGSGIGGLVGRAENSEARIEKSYSLANVSIADFANPNLQPQNLGGFIGFHFGQAKIYNSYATGSVVAPAASRVGGFVGGAHASPAIYSSYSTGFVEGGTFVGGFVGHATNPTLIANYWDKESSGQENSAIEGTVTVIGLTTAEMLEPASFPFWSSAIWNLVAGYYPTLFSNPEE